MSTVLIERILEKQAKEVTTGVTFAIKELGGSYARKPVEEIYGHNELLVDAHKAHFLRGNFQPLVDFVDMITRKRALDRFRLHELMRAGLCFKKVMHPLLVEQGWDDRDAFVRSMMALDKSVDRFVVNLSQAFVHYAKDYINKDPLEFPVWLERGWKATSSQASDRF